MRKLIAAMKLSLDGKAGDETGYADWVHAWSDDYGLTSEVDACLLGGGMYPGYETYWTAIQTAPEEPLPMTGSLAAPAEIEWGRFAARTPHYVLSKTIGPVAWPQTRVLRQVEDVAELKRQPGKGIYLVGGPTTTASLIDAGLVDELRLIVFPLIVGGGLDLMGKLKIRRALELRQAETIAGGCLRLTYSIG